VSDDPTPPAAFDCRTTDHEEIRAWIETHGGQPVVRQDPDAERLAVTFGTLDRAIETAVGYERFFERFEATDRLFAYQKSPDAPADAYAVFDRTRVAASNRLGEAEGEAGHANEAPVDAPRTVEPEPDGVRGEDGSDGGTEPRHEAARDGANPDDHRDEPPHMS
jgi:hypothetical protein